jgi:23S rRNA (uracil1939-C5)-methyltransferase
VLRTTGKPLDIHFTASDRGLDVDVRGTGPLPPARLTELARLADKHNLARITRHGELALQRTEPTLKIGRADVPLPSGAFLQATAEGEAALARLVQAHAGKAKRVVDLFSGIGTFTLRLAETARVAAVDSEANAIKALERGVKSTPGLKSVEARTRDLFRNPMVAMEMKGFDAVVFDPPRQGAERQAQELAASKVPMVIGVSCDASTFARDARILIDGGYKLTSVTPVDQFRYSHHVEIVGRFER